MRRPLRLGFGLTDSRLGLSSAYSYPSSVYSLDLDVCLFSSTHLSFVHIVCLLDLRTAIVPARIEVGPPTATCPGTQAIQLTPTPVNLQTRTPFQPSNLPNVSNLPIF